MKKPIFAAVAATLLTSPLFADSLIEYKNSMLEGTMKTLVSGIKQRTDMTMPMVGEQITITRVDKGVRWTLYPKKRMYSEEPIALPYHKMEEEKPAKRAKGKQEDEAENCTPVFKKAGGVKTIAGLKSTGYEMYCKESPKDKMTMWISEETPATKKIMDDQIKFGVANTKAMFANYPAKERAVVSEGAGNFMTSLVQGIPKMAEGNDFPKGMWTRFDMQQEGETLTAFELVKIAAVPVAASQFDVPAGYRKMKEGESPVGMGDLFSAEDKKEMKKGAKEETGQAAKKEAMKSLFKGLGNLGK